MRWLKRGPRGSPWLIVGLGNPGAGYVGNRHNVGFMTVEGWADRHGIAMNRKKPWAVHGEGEIALGGSRLRVLLAKPRTFMNASGDAVLELTRRHHVVPAKLVIVTDDMDLPLGKIRLRQRGSAGGHNGLASIIERFGTDDFARLRIGIGRPEDAEKGNVEHVLTDFADAERQVIDEAVSRACDALDCVLADGVDRAMSRFNAG